ncbi:MAG: O-antigen ligase family protein [Isosphaeraceae bacterium]
MGLRERILAAMERMQGAALIALVAGSGLCFGGAVWWFPAALALLAFAAVAIRLAQFAALGRFLILKSPLTFLWILALGLGVAQSLALPGPLARRVSPAAHEIWTTGGWSALARQDDPDASPAPAAEIRSPATVDRAATLRWLMIAAACLAVFWAASHHVDRLGRLYCLLGCVVGIFLINTALGIVQLGGGAEGLYGMMIPGSGPAWGPTADDLLESPAPAALRRVGVPERDGGPPIERLAAVADRPVLIGTMMGGPDAVLAMGSMALPLGLGILLHLLSPRGSRESLGDRLGRTGLGSLSALMVVLLATGSFLAGMMAGPRFSLPFAAAVVMVGLPGVISPTVRWLSLGLTMLLLASLGLGAAAVDALPAYLDVRAPVMPISWEGTQRLWSECLPIVRDFPILGTGFGTFPTIHAYFKTQDLPSGPAMSSLLQGLVESGWSGVALAALAGLWMFVRLPSSVKRVGTADRVLAHGLIGAAVGFTLWSVLHWTVELPAVAISASALGGTCNRWLAGGTDLFVDRA